jgi:hypothetical protein
VVACSLSVPVLAQPVTVEESDVLQRWELNLGGFITGLRTVVRFDEIAGNGGTEVNLEDDLGYSDRDDIFRFSAAYLIGRRHQIGVSYYESHREGLMTIDEEIRWGDETFPIGADVTSFYDAELGAVEYTYWARSRERSALGASFGLVGFGLSSGAALLDRTTPIGFKVESDFSLDVPVPQFGVRYRRALSERWLFKVGASFVIFEDIDDFSGDVISGALTFEYDVWRKLALGGGFALQDFDIDSGEKRTLGKYVFEVRGLYFYLRFGV